MVYNIFLLNYLFFNSLFLLLENGLGSFSLILMKVTLNGPYFVSKKGPINMILTQYLQDFSLHDLILALEQIVKDSVKRYDENKE